MAAAVLVKAGGRVCFMTPLSMIATNGRLVIGAPQGVTG